MDIIQEKLLWNDTDPVQNEDIGNSDSDNRVFSLCEYKDEYS